MNPPQVLEGKLIVIGVTGSIAAVELVKLIHELRRRGARVQAVMSPAAAGIITSDALSYACGSTAITRISGHVEHVLYCGDDGTADLLLIAPCTANTLSKIACGIDDTPVTTFATTAIGSGLPVIVVPAMHHSMFRHPGLQENIRRLQSWGVGVLLPRIEEGKAKMPEQEEIILHCEREVLGRPLAGKKVLITSGPCREPVDDVRILTTRSTGMIGRALALEAFRLGGDVTVVHRDTFPCVTNIPVETATQMHDAVMGFLEREKGTDIYISAAAISDFAPERYDGKIQSGRKTTLQLQPLQKILPQVIEAFHPLTVAFKIGRDPEKEARKLLETGISIVLANKPPTMGSPDGDYLMITQDGSIPVLGSKEEIAGKIFSELRNLS